MFNNYTLKLVRPACHTRDMINGIIELDTDIREVFPYLNAELENCFYHPEAPFLRFTHWSKAFTLHPEFFTINGLSGEEEARHIIEFVRTLLVDTWSRRDEIVPSYRRGTELKILDVYKLLPRTNCGKCIQKNCMAFAGHLIKQGANLDECTPLQEQELAATLQELTSILKTAGFAI